jgi:hypothetical protein
VTRDETEKLTAALVAIRKAQEVEALPVGAQLALRRTGQFLDDFLGRRRLTLARES